MCLVSGYDFPSSAVLHVLAVLFSGSPFTVNVGGQGANRLRESITRERRAADITHIGSQCELLLKIPGKLSVDRGEKALHYLDLK